MLTKDAKILGVDKRKMSKSYGNAIALTDSEDEIRRKIQSMVSDTQRIRKSDPGHPDECFVHYYLRLFADPETNRSADASCLKGEKGCSDIKGILADAVTRRLRPIHDRRKQFSKEKVRAILVEGRKRAADVAGKTMHEVRELLHLYTER